MKQVFWIDQTKWGEIIVRKFKGIPISENEETITIKYNRKVITLKKEGCAIYNI